MNFKVSKQGWVIVGWFMLLFFAMFFFLELDSILTKEPFGLHFIRQTDSMAFVEGYKQSGFSFWEPSILNLQSKDGKAACEFPLLYYLTAHLSWLFSNEAAVMRCFSLCLYAFGLYHFFRVLMLRFKSVVVASSSTLLLASSTVLIYYSANFLPDIPALGLCLAASFILVDHLKTESTSSNRPIVASYILFSFASLLKITFLIYPLAFFLVILLERLKSNLTWKQLKPYLIGLVGCLVISVSWYGYAIWYNAVNESDYFLTRWAPIWNQSEADIFSVLTHILQYWKVNYYYETTIHVMIILLFTVLILGFRRLGVLWNLMVIMLLGCISYFFFFFEKFRDHDYYIIEFIPLIALLFYLSIQVLQQRLVHFRIFRLLCVLGLGTLSLLSLNYGRHKFHSRISAKPDLYSMVGFLLNDGEVDLDRLAGSKENSVVVYGDRTVDGSLYFLRRRGLSISELTLEETRVNKDILLQHPYHLVLDTSIFKHYRLDPYLENVGSVSGFKLYRRIN